MTKNVTQLHLFVKLGNALAHVFEISVRKGVMAGQMPIPQVRDVELQQCSDSDGVTRNR